MAQPQNNNRRPPTALREYTLRLVGEPINGERRGPTFGVNVQRNQPLFEVRTNITNDKDYGRIQAKPDAATFFAVLQLLDEVADAPADTKYTVAISAHRFINGQRSKEPMLDSKVMVGKDKDGVVYIAVLSWDKERAAIKFPFRPSNFHHITDTAGNAPTLAKLSEVYAKSWATMLRNLVGTVLVNEYVEPPPRDNQGGGQGGGNRGGYGGGGGGGGYGGNTNNNSNGGQGGGGGGGFSGDDDFPL